MGETNSAFTSYHIGSQSVYGQIFPEFSRKYMCEMCYKQLKSEAKPGNKTQIQNTKHTFVLCKYLKNGRCQAISDFEKGRDTLEESCLNVNKKACCYECPQQQNCRISCVYLGKPDLS
jgi:hypothetical protein